MQITLNEEKLSELYDELGLKRRPVIRLTAAPNADHATRGTATGNSITITYGLRSQAVDRLHFVQSQIVRTLLHEIRHIWQFENWNGYNFNNKSDYWVKREEIDAREFADNNLAKWRGIVRVSRPVRSRLSKLSASERIVRQ